MNMTFSQFLKDTSYEEFSKYPNATINPDQEEIFIKEGMNLLQVMEKLAADHRLGRAYALFSHALEEFFLSHPEECTALTMSLITSLVDNLAAKNLEGLHQEYLGANGPVKTTLAPYAVSHLPAFWVAGSNYYHLDNRSVLMARGVATKNVNAIALPEATHCVIDSTAAECDIYTSSCLATVFHSGRGNILMTGRENFAGIIGGQGANVEATGYRNNVFSTGSYTRISMTNEKAGSVFASGPSTKINLTAPSYGNSAQPCVFSFGQDSSVTVARYTHACFVRGKGSRLCLIKPTRKLLLGEGVRMYTYCSDECEQLVPVVLEGGKDLEADKVYEWDEETRWYKGLPYPISLPE